MKILVTGAAGFIGYHIVHRLISDGHDVTGIDNLCDPSARELKLARLAQLGIAPEAIIPGTPQRGSDGRFTFIQADIRDRQGLIALCQQESFEDIIHLAARAGVPLSLEEPVEVFDTNVVGTQNALEAARLSGVRHFFFSSSSVVHGAHAQSPLREDDDVDAPLNMYAGSKRASELLCYTYAQAYNLPVTVFRFFTAYGPWGRPDSVPMTIARDIAEGNTITVLNNGYLVRDFTYVDDIVDGVVSALLNPYYAASGAPYALYNIGRSKPVPFLSFIQSIEMAMGRRALIQRDPASPLTRGESVEMYADTRKLETELAYSPVWDYEEAVPLFIDWFRNHYNISFHS